MDLIRITGLQVEAHVGVTEEERANAQPLIVNLELRIALAPAGASDDLSDTTDYGAVSIAVADLVRASRVNLLEHLAELIVAEVRNHPKVQWVAVEVLKVNPPIPEKLESVGVRIERDLE